jgi:hypothetical protein
MVDICTKAIPNLGWTVDLNQSQIKEGKKETLKETTTVVKSGKESMCLCKSTGPAIDAHRDGW